MQKMLFEVSYKTYNDNSEEERSVCTGKKKKKRLNDPFQTMKKYECGMTERYLVFVPGSWPKVPKMLGFPE